jgi:archaellum component FlaG (FlaF/FlaG flagellin family)
MIRKILPVFIYLLFHCMASFSQSDPFIGTWQIDNAAGENKCAFSLQVASPENGILYPAHITIQCDSFTAAYELLLVKKSSRELSISKNKFARDEKPFSLTKQLFYVNGIFDLSRDLKGQPTLNLRRIQFNPNDNMLPDTVKRNSALLQTFRQIKKLLLEDDIKLYKLSNTAWSSDYANRILSPAISPAYFGLTDTIYIPSRDGTVSFSGLKKGDVVSAAVNGKRVTEMLELSKKSYTQDIVLDTGLNILVLYADNFANGLPNKGKLDLECGKKKVTLDFSNRGDSGASFIAVKLFFAREKEKETFFDNYTPAHDKPLKENEKLLGTLTSTARQLTLAIWDDAVEDGDSISINVNGKWIARGFPVKIKPQTITITLDPGPNTITFVADNLGSIPPNTSILEIIDGKRRKAFTLATTIGEDNLVKIFYDLQPGQ